MSAVIRLPRSLCSATISWSFPYPHPSSVVLLSLRTTEVASARRWYGDTARRGHNGGKRSYEDAIKLLEQLQSNQAVVSVVSDAPHDRNAKAIPEMLEWTRKAGYAVDDFATGGLKFVHVAGTKGKGSVCTLVENILLQYRKPEHDQEGNIGKVGLYTSPHLVHVRERIKIDGLPIPESMFTQYFFELWDRYANAALASKDAPHALNNTPEGVRPAYFRFLTILALHVFLKEGVETAIIECGIGGEYDSTNIIPPGAVTATAITQLGIDHVSMLGDTIESIAWHKSGIMKTGVRCFTVLQDARAQAVLSTRARDKGVDLTIVQRNSAFDANAIKLGLEGDVQKDNASLAVAVATCHLEALSLLVSTAPLPAPFRVGLETARLLGRCQVLKDGNIEWLLDGAHTIDSITHTAEWFKSKIIEAKASAQPPTVTMLIFAAQGQGRDPEVLLRTLTNTEMEISALAEKPVQFVRNNGKQFTYAAFCKMDVLSEHAKFEEDEKKQLEQLARTYQTLDGNSLYSVEASIQSAVELARRISKDEERVMILVTGSLHLVGGLMKVLEWEKGAAVG